MPSPHAQATHPIARQVAHNKMINRLLSNFLILAENVLISEWRVEATGGHIKRFEKIGADGGEAQCAK